MKFVLSVLLFFYLGSAFAGSAKPPQFENEEGYEPSLSNFYHREFCWLVAYDAQVVVWHMSRGASVKWLKAKAKETGSMSPQRRKLLFTNLGTLDEQIKAGIDLEVWRATVIKSCADSDFTPPNLKSAMQKVQSEQIVHSVNHYGRKNTVQNCPHLVDAFFDQCIPEIQSEANIGTLDDCAWEKFFDCAKLYPASVSK